MTDREEAGRKALEFSENLWKDGDFWELETSEYERGRYARLIEVLRDRRYARGLELGCGAGYFTRLVAPLVDHLVAYDISPSAITRARPRQRTRNVPAIASRAALRSEPSRL